MGHHLRFVKKNVLPPLEPNLLEMLGRINEVLQIEYEVLHRYRTGAEE
jgi:hypothetical protein